MDQTMVDRAVIAVFPELKRLVALRASTDWSLSVVFDQNRQFQLVSGARSHVEGSRDDIGVRSDTEVRVVRHNPLGEAVVMREGSLAEMVELVLGLPSPLHPLAPRRVLGGSRARDVGSCTWAGSVGVGAVVTVIADHRPGGAHSVAMPVEALTLAALPSAVSCTRMLVWHVKDRGGLPAGYGRRIEAAAEELVIHAVAVTGVSEAAPWHSPVFDNLQVIEVSIHATRDRAVIEVRDRASSPPHHRLGASTAIANAEDWGHTLLPGGWRAVWCVVADNLSTSAVSLPAQRLGPDTQTLRRVLDGLHRRL